MHVTTIAPSTQRLLLNTTTLATAEPSTRNEISTDIDGLVWRAATGLFQARAPLAIYIFKIRKSVCHVVTWFACLSRSQQASRYLLRGVGSWDPAGEGIPLYVGSPHHGAGSRRGRDEGQRLQSRVILACNNNIYTSHGVSNRSE